jgi:hypothetical protein
MAALAVTTVLADKSPPDRLFDTRPVAEIVAPANATTASYLSPSFHPVKRAGSRTTQILGTYAWSPSSSTVESVRSSLKLGNRPR